MSRYTDQPTSEEAARWAREAEYFSFREPNPNAPPATSAAIGWGVPREYKPPVDAVHYVTAIFKREVAGCSVDKTLRPEFEWSIFSVCLAHFLWLRTKEGVTWLLRFYAIEEVPPFTEAYTYFYLNKAQLIDGRPARVPIGNDSGIQLRIFRRCERDLDPPIESPLDESVSTMRDILRKARNPNATELIAEATPDMYHWVSEQLREWFLETKVDKHWPTYKENRITGYEWAKNLESRPGQLVYSPLTTVDTFNGRAYRLKDRDGDVRWGGKKKGNGTEEERSDVVLMTKPDFLRSEGTISEHLIQGRFQCSSCGMLRPCTPVTQSQKMCCHCFGKLCEKGERPTLNWCTMGECKNCPEHLESNYDLINLKNRLNREATFPVKR